MTDDRKAKIIAYYDQEAESYGALYEKPFSEQEAYPANAIRLELIVQRLQKLECKTLLDVGCGSGAPLVRFIKEGFDARGFDFSSKMVTAARRALRRNQIEPSRAFIADMEEIDTLPDGKFDSVVATGVFPHNLDVGAAYANLRKLLAPKGVAMIEYRNALMSLFSLNQYSEPFFWNHLLEAENLPKELRTATREFLAKMFCVPVGKVGIPREIEYTDILARFHNPLTLGDELEQHGFKLEETYFYHFHAAPPHLEKQYTKQFWETSLKKEMKRDWRAMFMCSAFVAEVRIH